MLFSRLGVQIALTVAGGVYVSSAVLLALWWLAKPISVPVDKTKDLLPYVAAGFVAISYMVGVIAYEAIIVSLRPLSLIFERRFAWSNLRVARNSVPGSPSELEVEVWHRGSERLTHELDGMVANLWLVRLLLVGLPILALAILLWSRSVSHGAEGKAAAAVLVAASAVLVLGHRNQVRRMKAFLNSAHKVMTTNPCSGAG